MINKIKYHNFQDNTINNNTKIKRIVIWCIKDNQRTRYQIIYNFELKNITFETLVNNIVMELFNDNDIKKLL